MGRSRLSSSLLLAGTLGLLSVGCVGPAPSGPPPASPGPETPASPPASPQEQSPTATPDAEPSGPATYETTLIQGKVYDAGGKFVPDGTSVIVRSLDDAVAFQTTVTTNRGAYVVTGAPIGHQLEITATRDGWTRRTRVEVPVKNERNLPRLNTYHFGGPRDDNDPSGRAYFISDYPEIERVEPVDDATSLPHEQLSFKLVMSEPLDATNQRRLSSAFLIVPNSQEALTDGAALPQETATSADLQGLRAGANPLTDSPYRFRQNSSFLNGVVFSEFRWDADSRTATFKLEAPVKTDDTAEAQYAFLLVQADDNEIVDGNGLPLGMDDNQRFGNLNRGELIRYAVKETEVSLGPGEDDDTEERWANTHLSYTKFSVAPDRTAPTVASVLARRGYSDGTGVFDRIEITFSEPMIAFPQVMSPQLLSLNNYIITAGATEEALAGRTLKTDGSANDVESGATLQAIRDAIAGQTGAVIGANGNTLSSADSTFSIALSVKDPKTVVLQLPGGSLPLDANFVKVLAGTDANAVGGVSKPVTDPAGNHVDPARNQILGPIN